MSARSNPLWWASGAGLEWKICTTRNEDPSTLHCDNRKNFFPSVGPMFLLLKESGIQNSHRTQLLWVWPPKTLSLFWGKPRTIMWIFDLGSLWRILPQMMGRKNLRTSEMATKVLHFLAKDQEKISNLTSCYVQLTYPQPKGPGDIRSKSCQDSLPRMESCR